MGAHDFYPTRGAKEQVLERVDPVVYGDRRSRSPYALGPEQLDRFEADGFLIVPDVFSGEEAAGLLREFQRLGALEEMKEREELILEPDSEEPRSLFSVERFSPLFDRVSRDRRILDKVYQILDDGVYIHHSRINIKPALHGRSFSWHSDFETWHAEDGLPRMRTVTAWIMLTDNHEFNGPLYVIPGSHKYFIACEGETPEDHHKKSLRRQEYGVPSLEILQEFARERGLAGLYGRPGTLVFHETNTLHGSPDNISPWPRTNAMFVYNSVHNAPAPKPFGAKKLRPEFLGSRDVSPVEPVEPAGG